MAAGGVGEDLDTVQTHVNVWSTRREQLLTELDTNASVKRRHDYVSNWNNRLLRDRLNDAWQEEVLSLAVFQPWREMSKFAVVAIVSHPHFGTDEDDFAIADDDSAVVGDIFVPHWHTNVADYTMRLLVAEELGEYFPRVEDCVT